MRATRERRVPPAQGIRDSRVRLAGLVKLVRRGRLGQQGLPAQVAPPEKLAQQGTRARLGQPVPRVQGLPAQLVPQALEAVIQARLESLESLESLDSLEPLEPLAIQEMMEPQEAPEAQATRG